MNKSTNVFFTGCLKTNKTYVHILNAFRKRFTEVKTAKEADYIIHVNRDGTANTVGDIMNKPHKKSVAIVTNPFGINAWNGDSNWSVITLCLESVSPLHMKRIQVWDPDRWKRIATKWNLPQGNGWSNRSFGKIVVLLPKFGGWNSYKLNEFISRYTKIIASIRSIYPEDTISVRMHPRNIRWSDAGTKKIQKEISNCDDNIVMDKNPEITWDSMDNTKMVVCDWSTAVVRFVMKGVPVYNAEKNHPTKMIADPVAFRDLKSTVDPDFSGFMEPDAFLNALAQSTFEVDDIMINGINFLQ
ncbi:hypothetical protein TetV_634 [Tetraselmis virus 1]|uniref:Uncharacterized protein n=1 Tax=Tetraselmis virus 1 TaxID=2060617 RepID=A0A2P0VP74_9VIRU|nr:hypothetical protein QJ968_gp420 [Tetraselmis virus 1]AUF82716.1 hypothetical protein TetV_634 [Tetraselmis virus 1]